MGKTARCNWFCQPLSRFLGDWKRWRKCLASWFLLGLFLQWVCRVRHWQHGTWVKNVPSTAISCLWLCVLWDWECPVAWLPLDINRQRSLLRFIRALWEMASNVLPVEWLWVCLSNAGRVCFLGTSHTTRCPRWLSFSLFACFCSLRTAVLNLWVSTPSGVKWPFQLGSQQISLHIRYWPCGS